MRTFLDRLRRWIMRGLGVRDRYQEGFANGRYYALRIFNGAMFDAKLSSDQQIQIHQFMVAADEQNQNMGTIDLK